jgi:molecular chaperone Hsp33
VAEALNDYMRHSEQIATHFVLAANAHACAGILVQEVPQQGGRESQETDPDTWNRIRTLTATLTSAELLELGDEEVLRRLFHQEEVRVLPPRPVRFVCRCSKERVGSVLKLLGAEEIRGLLADRRTIEVDCDFCGQRYAFSAEEAWTALNG